MLCGAIFALGDAVSAERVGAQYVGAGRGEIPVDRFRDLRFGQRQYFMVALEIDIIIGETGTAIILLAQAELLDHGTLGAFYNEYFFLKQFF